MNEKKSTSKPSSHTKNTTKKIGGKNVVEKFNSDRYAKLLLEYKPHVIRNDEDLDRMISFIEPLFAESVECHAKGKSQAPERRMMLDLLSQLIRDYEATHHPIPTDDIEPHQMLKYFMEEQGLIQKDLLSVFGSHSRVSDAVNGKRPFSKKQVKELAAFFNVSPMTFF